MSGEFSWSAIVIGAVMIVGSWLVVGVSMVRWWRQERARLWCVPLMWLLLLVFPYFEVTLLVPRVRRWWWRLATARPRAVPDALGLTAETQPVDSQLNRHDLLGALIHEYDHAA
jgi:hypothetical protein